MKEHTEPEPREGEVVVFSHTLPAGSLQKTITGESVRMDRGVTGTMQRRIVKVIGYNPAYKAWIVVMHACIPADGPYREHQFTIRHDGTAWREAC